MTIPIRRIRTEAEYEAAIAEVERLWGAPRGTPAGDRLVALTTLIDAYDAEHDPSEPPDPIAAIERRMEQLGLTREDLEPIIGSRGRVAKVLDRKRDLSLPMVRRLHAHLGIPAEVLIRPVRLDKAA